MAHELTQRANGKVEMAYVGDTPWHGLGEALIAGASIETWVTAAGMDWNVCRSRVRFGEGPNQKIMDDKHVLFRSDSKDPLGIVSKNFKIVQPKAILEFFRDLVAEGGLQLETAGTLFGGKRFWALAKTGASAEVVHGDKVGGYVLLCTGADGSLATTAKFTTVRVVCNNTLTAALPGDALRVTHRSVFDASQMKANMGLARQSFDVFMTNMRVLAEKTLDPARAANLTVQLLAKKPGKLSDEERTVIVDAKPYRTIMDLYSGTGRGARMAGVADTAWGWVNGVTEFVDHIGVSHSADNRMNSAWFGPGEAMKNRAVDLALAV